MLSWTCFLPCSACPPNTDLVLTRLNLASRNHHHHGVSILELSKVKESLTTRKDVGLTSDPSSPSALDSRGKIPTQVIPQTLKMVDAAHFKTICCTVESPEEMIKLGRYIKRCQEVKELLIRISGDWQSSETAAYQLNKILRKLAELKFLDKLAIFGQATPCDLLHRLEEEEWDDDWWERGMEDVMEDPEDGDLVRIDDNALADLIERGIVIEVKGCFVGPTMQMFLGEANVAH